MAKKQLKGISIYKDKQGRTVFYDRYTAKSYLLPYMFYKEYTLWSLRIPLSILIAACLTYIIPVRYALATGIAFYAVSTLLFHFLLVNKLPAAKGFQPDPSEASIMNKLYKDMSFKRMMIVIPLFALLGGITYYSILFNLVSDDLVLVYYAVMLFCFAGTISFAVMAVRKHREEKQ